MGNDRQKLSLIILTHNSHEHLKRILLYYEFKGVGYRIIIADSSCATTSEINCSFLTGIKLNCIHLQFPEDIHPYLKIKKALEVVSTSYSLIVANDDFILPFAINKCIDFLEMNSDYVSASGASYSFTYSKVKKELSFFLRNGGGLRSIEQQCPAERLEDVLSNYLMLFYSVVRTVVLHEIISEINTYFRHFKFGEYFLNGFFLLKGKAKFIVMPYIFRELNDFSGGISLDVDWLTRGDFDLYFSIFNERLTLYLSSVSNLSQEKSLSKVFRISSLFIEKNKMIAKILPAKRGSFLFSATRSLAILLFPGFIKARRDYYKSLEIKKDDEIKKKCAVSLLKDETKEFYKEFELIKLFIKQSQIVCFSKRKGRSLLEV